jgi:hypothetical protein
MSIAQLVAVSGRKAQHELTQKPPGGEINSNNSERPDGDDPRVMRYSDICPGPSKRQAGSFVIIEHQ